MMADPTETRLRLRSGDYDPLPLEGKACFMEGWQTKFDVGCDEISLWAKLYPSATNTGFLCRRVPTLDIDVMHPEAAEAIEELIRSRYEDDDHILVRIGRAPKRAIPFKCDVPFAKITANLIGPDGSNQKIEFLADGQQVACFGDHPDTRRNYAWHGGEPGEVPRDELPSINVEQAQQLVEDAVELLVREHGFKLSRQSKQANGGVGHPADWETLVANIISGVDYHESVTRLAASYIGRGHSISETISTLQGLMRSSTAPQDARWESRFREIPRAVKSAAKKFTVEVEQTKSQEPPPEPKALDQVVDAFDHWLALKDKTPLYAMLGCVAANLLPGDPVWLGIIASSSNAKTELLNALARLPHVVNVEMLTPASLLSGTPKQQQSNRATGGLLRQIGPFGLFVVKDFSTVLDMRVEQRNETISALRRVFDGEYNRPLGSEGGRIASWSGKVGLLFAATQKYDLYHAVIGSLGDRFLLVRLDGDNNKQFDMCFLHSGPAAKAMRAELAASVGGLFSGLPDPLPEPEPMNDEERAELREIVMLAIRLRAGVERDRMRRDIEAVYDPEGPARLALTLARLFDGCLTIGLSRAQAMDVVKRVALDSTPQLRRRAYNALNDMEWQSTREIATAINLPTVTTRRLLEELTAQRLAEREGRQDAADGGDDGELDLDPTADKASKPRKKSGADYWRRLLQGPQ
jgi:hypothetical protein